MAIFGTGSDVTRRGFLAGTGSLLVSFAIPTDVFAQEGEVAIKAMPGVIAVVREGDFLAVAAQQEFQAVQAMRALAGNAKWQESASLPDRNNIGVFLEKSVTETGVIASVGAETTEGVKTFKGQFTRPYQTMAQSVHRLPSRSSTTI